MIPTFEQSMTAIKHSAKRHQINSSAPLPPKVEQDILEAKIDNLESELELTKKQFERTEHLYEKI